MSSLRAYLAVARAPFLLLPVTLAAVGGAAAAYDGAFLWSRTILSLVALVAAHVAVNALNEASDFRAGIDLETIRTPFSGGSGTLPAGTLGPGAARNLGLGGFLVAAGLGAYLCVVVGWVLLPVVVAGALCVLLYSDFLARIGAGEIAAGLGLGALPVIGIVLVQGGGLGPAGIAVSVPAFCMTFNLLLLNEFPDEAADRRGGRKNLVLLLGRRGAARVYVAAGVAGALVLTAAAALGHLPLLALLGLLPLLLFLRPLGWALREPEEPVPIPALGANVVWILATNLLTALGLAIEVLQ